MVHNYHCHPLSAVRKMHLLSIKELIYIRVYDTTLKRNNGKYSLLHTWDKVLFTSKEFKFKNYKNLKHTTPVPSTTGSFVE